MSKCEEKQSIDLLIFIISKCSHGSLRQTIRRTWTNQVLFEKYFPNIHLKHLFLLDFDHSTQQEIQLEHQIYGDLVQVINLPQQYHFVTYREASIYKFVTQYCSNVKFLLKTDDDIFIDLFRLFQTTNSFNLFSLNTTDLNIYGYPIDHGLVVRQSIDSIGERYIITDEEYSCSHYPRFLSGFGYLMSIRVCSLLIKLFEMDQNPFPLSDVYFTGLLPEIFGLKRKYLFESVDYLYLKSCDRKFFESLTKQGFACAASSQHFHVKENEISSMNEYNQLWMTIKRKFFQQTFK